MNYFYGRVSSRQQNLDRQLLKARELNIPDDRVFADKMSGKNTKRPEWQKLNRILTDGDTLIVSSMSRLSRSLNDLLSISTDLTERGVDIQFLKENIDTTSSTGRMMLGVIGSVHEFQREIIVENVREGVSVAINKREVNGTTNASGHRWGGNKEKPLTDEQLRVLQLWIAKDIKTADAKKILKCSRATLYNLKAKM